MWKALFIGITVLMIYFSYGIAAHGGVWAFFVGAAVGSVVTYLFTRARKEAAENHNTNTQNVSVNLSQNKVAMNGSAFSEDQLVAIAEIVSSMQERKQLLSQRAPILNDRRYEEDEEIYDSQRLADLLRERRSNHA